MAYQFDQSQVNQLSSLLATAGTTSNYTPVYQYIYDQITLNGTPKSGVDTSVWLWVRGAKGVNANDGTYFSNYIRDWTKAEYFHREGMILSDGKIQEASDNIITKFANDILNNNPLTPNPNHYLPTLQNTGIYDAGSIASGLFESNYSPWAGTILFAYLGDGSFVRNWLLTNSTVSNPTGGYYKAIPGTYDLVAAAQVAHEITGFWETLAARSELADTINNNSIGRAATKDLLANLRTEANDFFQHSYGLPDVGQWQIGGDLPLYADDAFISGADYYIRPNFIMGRVDDDQGIWAIHTNGTTLFGYDTDIVNAGPGNDLIYGSQGNDLIDGADGTDTLDWSLLSAAITVTQQSVNGTLYKDRLVVTNSATTFTTYAYGIEKIVGTNSNDTFTIGPGDGLIIDGGGGAGDRLTVNGDHTLIVGNALRVSNVENITMASGKSGYFIIEKMGNTFVESTQVTSSAVPLVYTTLDYRGYDKSLTFSFDTILSLDGGAQAYITDSAGNIDRFSHNVSIVGSNNGDTYILRQYALVNGYYSSQEGTHGNVPIFTGTGNDLIYAGNQPLIYTAGHDVLKEGFGSVNSQSFIMPLGVKLSDLSFSMENLRLISAGENMSFYKADAKTSINGRGSIYVTDLIEYYISSHVDPTQDGTGQLISNVFSIQTESDVLLAYFRATISDRSGIVSGFSMNTASLMNPEQNDYEEEYIAHYFKPMFNSFYKNFYHGTFESDKFDLNAYYAFDNFNAYDGDDVVLGSAQNNIIYGGAGNDKIKGNGGNDTIYGGDGVDYAFFSDAFANYSLSDETAYISIVSLNGPISVTALFDIEKVQFSDGVWENGAFTPGIQTSFPSFPQAPTHPVLPPTSPYIASAGNDTLNASTSTMGVAIDLLAGNDSFSGSEYVDSILGNSGDDYIFGAGGSDIINGGSGKDVLEGGVGSDVYIFAVGDSPIATPDKITVVEGEGFDTIKLVGVLPQNVYMFQDQSVLGLWHLRYSATDEILIQGMKQTSPTTWVGTDYTISKVAFDNGTVWDFTNGMTINDTNDAHRLTGTTFADTLNGNGGNDTLYGNSGSDTLLGGDGDDRITGSSSVFVAYDGLPDNDILDGGKGADTLEGSWGDDTYVFRAGDSPAATPDYVNEIVNQGTDTIKLTGGILPSAVTFTKLSSNYWYSIKFGTDEIRLVNYTISGNSITSTNTLAFEKLAFDNGTVLNLSSIINAPPPPANTNPVAKDDIFSGNEDTQITGNVLANNGNGADSDADGNLLSVVALSGVTTANGGTVNLLTNGNFTYTPAANYFGADSFSYTLQDGQGGSDTGLVSLTINQVTPPPPPSSNVIAAEDFEGGATGWNKNNTDATAPFFTEFLGRFGNNTGVQELFKTFTLNGNQSQVTIDFDFYRIDTWDSEPFKIYLNDNLILTENYHHSTAKAAATGTFTGGTWERDAGIAINHYGFGSGGSAWRDGAYHYTLTLDTTATTLKLGFGATLDGTIANESWGIDNLVITSDGGGAPPPPVNTNPVAKDDIFSGNEDTQITGNVLANNGNGADSDADGNLLSVVALSGVTTANGGTVNLLTNGNFTYTPAANYFGADSFSYTLQDGQGGSDTGLVSLTIASVNDNPLAKDDIFTGNQDVQITGNVLVNNGNGVDSDSDGGTLSVVVATGLVTTSGGSVNILANGNFTYTPAANYFGADSFSYTLQDGQGGSDTGLVSLTINQVTPPPPPPASSNVIADEDFEGGATGWNDNRTDATASFFTEFLGRFGGTAGAQGLFKTFAMDGNQTQVTIDFDFYRIDTWDTEPFKIYLNDNLILTENYHHSTAKAAATGTFTGGTWERDAGIAINHYGFGSGGSAWRDGVYHYTLTLDTTATTLKLGFGATLDGTIANESWGIDNLVITSDSEHLYGTSGADVFAWLAEDVGTGIDTVHGFSTAQGDSLDVSDILSGYDPLTDLIADFVRITDNGTDSFLAVDADGGANNFIQIATLQGITGLTNEDALEASGNLVGV